MDAIELTQAPDYHQYMLRNKIALFIALILPILGCSLNQHETSEAEVIEWARLNLETALSQTKQIKPEFFEAALIPSDFEYPKSPADFDESGPPQEIATADAEFLRNVGIVSALAEHCQLEWNDRNFLPMMQWQRTRVPQSQRNGHLIYKMGFSHGYAMGTTDRILEHWEVDCDRLKSDLSGKLFADVYPLFSN